MQITCCKDCCRRRQSCHTDCPEYQHQLQELHKAKAFVKRENQRSYYSIRSFFVYSLSCFYSKQDKQ